MKVERNRAGNKYTFTAEDKEDEKFLDRVNKKIDELEEENKKLKEFKTKREESMFYFKTQMERAEPKTAREAEDLQRAKEIFEKLYREELSCLEEENKKLKKECEENDYLVEDNARWMKKCEEKTTEIKTLNEKVRFLEECLDRKEKLNEKYRKEIEELKSTYVYDAKQVRDIC